MNSCKIIHRRGSGRIRVKDIAYFVGIYPPTVYGKTETYMHARLSNWTYRSKPLSVPSIINENWSWGEQLV